MRSHYVFNSNQKGVTHVTLTTTIYRNKFRFCENKFQPYTIKCLLFLFIAVHLEVLQLFWLRWSGATMAGS